MSTWISRRYAIGLIDDELRRLAQLKLDTSPSDPRRPGIMRRIDDLLEQRNRAARHGQEN